jgi:CO/xanthine dehydrogenase Mo-binding subunit
MQPIALVLAETFEQARYAARLVKATYNEEKPMTRVEDALDKAFDPPGSALKPRGKPAEAFKAAPVKIEAVYTIPMEHHNPMEPHGAIAFWENDKLTIFDKTQGVNIVRQHLVASFNIPNENVQVISPFVGGAFGSSLRPNYYPALAAAAARELKRPVKLVYTRTQMFTGHGYRPYTWQKVALGAERDGKLTSMIHEAVKNASTFKDWTDGTTDLTRPLYACPNADTPNRIVKTDFATPESMRAPGAVSGMFALECAMDELAYALKMDPLELRLVNFTDVHPDSGKPYSSKALRECYRLGAKKFGWKNRKFEPRSMRDGRFLVGWGMATGVWGAWQRPAGVKITLKPDRTAHVASATSEISELMRRNNLTELVDVHEAKPSPEREKCAIGAHGAQFVEVKVDPDLGIVHVTRVIEVTASGKIMNPKTAHSQEVGGIVWGIGMALQEATEIDHRYGRIMNPNLQHYHVPVNADVLDYETIFLEEDDKIINPLGVKGMGELCQVGIPAAIANAVFHATGKRLRDLPITPDKLIG